MSDGTFINKSSKDSTFLDKTEEHTTASGTMVDNSTGTMVSSNQKQSLKNEQFAKAVASFDQVPLNFQDQKKIISNIVSANLPGKQIVSDIQYEDKPIHNIGPVLSKKDQEILINAFQKAGINVTIDQKHNLIEIDPKAFEKEQVLWRQEMHNGVGDIASEKLGGERCFEEIQSSAKSAFKMRIQDPDSVYEAFKKLSTKSRKYIKNITNTKDEIPDSRALIDLATKAISKDQLENDSSNISVSLQNIKDPRQKNAIKKFIAQIAEGTGVEFNFDNSSVKKMHSKSYIDNSSYIDLNSKKKVFEKRFGKEKVDEALVEIYKNKDVGLLNKSPVFTNTTTKFAPRNVTQQDIDEALKSKQTDAKSVQVGNPTELTNKLPKLDVEMIQRIRNIAKKALSKIRSKNDGGAIKNRHNHEMHTR